jgi:hypothetical protein
MPTLFEELKEVSQHIEIVSQEKRMSIRDILKNKAGWEKFSNAERILFYKKITLPSQFLVKIFLAYVLLANEIVSETKNNEEVSPDTINWFREN